MNEQALAGGRPPVYSEEDLLNNNVDTDWQSQVFQVAPLWETGLSIRGGSEKARHFISGNIFNQEGIIIGSGFRRYNLRMNYDYHISDRLIIETGNSFSYSVNQRVEGDQPSTARFPMPYPFHPFIRY
jgi:hypothetical protein